MDRVFVYCVLPAGLHVGAGLAVWGTVSGTGTRRCLRAPAMRIYVAIRLAVGSVPAGIERGRGEVGLAWRIARFGSLRARDGRVCGWTA